MRHCDVAQIIGDNVTRHADAFESDVRLWVFEEQVRDALLAD